MKKLILCSLITISVVFSMDCDAMFKRYNNEPTKLFDECADNDNADVCFCFSIALIEVADMLSKSGDYKKAGEYSKVGIDFLRRACNLGIRESCGILGNLYYDGKGVRQSYEKALQHHKKACDLGYGNSCAKVGTMYYDGKGVQKDLKTAIAFFAKSCKLESGGGCGMLGSFYHYGEGVKQNYSKAKELYGKACDLGFQLGCDWYKELKE